MTINTNPMSGHNQPLADLAQDFRGVTYKSSELSDVGTGVPLLNLKSVSRGGGLRADGIKFFAGVASNNNQRVAAGDILVAITDLTQNREVIGCPILVNDQLEEDSAVFSLDLVKLVVDEQKIKSSFLYYYLQSPQARDFLRSRSNGTTVLHLPVSEVRNLPVPVPPIAYQTRIVELLSAMDDRIGLCSSTMDTLLELIHAECEVAVKESSSEETITLPSAVRLVNGGAYTKGASGTGRMVIRIKDLKSGVSETTVFNDITVPSDKTAYPGDVLFAWSASLGVWRWVGEEAIINQHIFKVLPNEHPVWLGWFHIRNTLAEFQDIASGKATTMGHITKDHLERTLVPQLTTEEIQSLTQRVTPLWDYHLQLAQQVDKLRNLREFLLPRLLSGRLRVEEAAEMAEVSL